MVLLLSDVERRGPCRSLRRRKTNLPVRQRGGE